MRGVSTFFAALNAFEFCKLQLLKKAGSLWYTMDLRVKMNPVARRPSGRHCAESSSSSVASPDHACDNE